MKYKDLTKLAKDDLDKKLHDLRTELMKLNAQVAIGTTPKSTKQIRDIKRIIARFETLRMDNFHKKLDALEKSASTKHVKTVKKYTNL